MRAEKIGCQCDLCFTMDKVICRVVFLLVGFEHVIGWQTSEKLQLELADGPIRGYMATSYDNQSYAAYEGIPYAMPPIGDLRFAPPQKPQPWTTPLDANKTYYCTQFLPLQVFGDGVIGHEDCLYVNVYAPRDRATPNEKRNVVVHIHGGAFILGAPKLMAGPKYIMNEDVIYVSFNYRLGIFGFLSTGDEYATGNWGLKDQNLALRWIQDNIAKFGGDPKAVTLTGHSAGSASVHYHLLSAQSKGLFHRAVLMSGTALNPWALTEDPLSKAQKLGAEFNCPTQEVTNEKMITCLRAVSGRDLGKAVKGFFRFGNVLPVTPFGPTVEHDHEGAFISTSPYQLLKSGKIGSDVPMIISYVKDEGIFPVGYFVKVGLINNLINKWSTVMQYGLDIQDTTAASQWAETLTQVKSYYYPGNDLNQENLANLTQMWTDRFYLQGIENTIKLHLKSTQHPVYGYYFNYDSPAFNFFPVPKGVAHCEDLQLTFNLLTSPPKLTDEDHEMSKLMTKMISSFAENKANPLPDWLPMKQDGGDMTFLEITKHAGNKMISKVELLPNEFWNNLPVYEEY